MDGERAPQQPSGVAKPIPPASGGLVRERMSRCGVKKCRPPVSRGLESVSLCRCFGEMFRPLKIGELNFGMPSRSLASGGLAWERMSPCHMGKDSPPEGRGTA